MKAEDFEDIERPLIIHATEYPNLLGILEKGLLPHSMLTEDEYVGGHGGPKAQEQFEKHGCISTWAYQDGDSSKFPYEIRGLLTDKKVCFILSKDTPFEMVDHEHYDEHDAFVEGPIPINEENIRYAVFSMKALRQNYYEDQQREILSMWKEVRKELKEKNIDVVEIEGD